MAKGVLAILGSGETAPGMTKVHRELLSRLDEVRAVNLDTPYGFQLNVPQMSQKLADYFQVSLQTKITSLPFTSFSSLSGVEKELLHQQIKESTYVFAGPGSPTYALNQWKPFELQNDLIHVLSQGGSVCFSSAAALTIGAFTAPIYEIYKAGSDLYWLDGLNLMSLIGLNCVVIPHFDNKEGENYDTRFCYLGEVRLTTLETQLPEGTATLGVDEHTAVLFDLESETFSVTGKGDVHWRINKSVQTFTSGNSYPMSELSTLPAVMKPLVSGVTEDDPVELSPLKLANIVELGGGGKDVALARLVELASKSGEGLIDPTEIVNAILEARISARSDANYTLADQLRDLLINAGILVNDGPSGTTWELNKN